MAVVDLRHGAAVERFAVRGMTCGSCAARVEAALLSVPGVRHARVDLRTGTAEVQCDPTPDSPAELRRAVAEAGYSLATLEPERTSRLWPRSLAYGLLATSALLAFYLGIIAIAQGWEHAVQQLAEDRWFVAAITAGFGVQVGLFTYLRRLRARASAGAVAATGGTSTAAMLACCAHHLADVLPIIGLSGAAVFLGTYKTPLLWLGVASNLAGIVYLLGRVREYRRAACH